MSREAREWAWNTAPTDDPRQLLILLSLADVADEFGCNSYPSVSRLARDCRSNPRTVQRHLSSMVEAGILEVEKPSSQHRPTTYRMPNADPRGDKMTPLEDVDKSVENPPGVTQGRLRGDSGVTKSKSIPIHLRTGNGIGNSRDSIETQFDEVWKTYPRKIDRIGALKCFKTRVREGIPIADLARAAENYAKTRSGEDETYTMHGKRFFGPNHPWKDYLEGVPEKKIAANGNDDGFDFMANRVRENYAAK